MQKLVSKRRVKQLIQKYKKPLVLAQNGEMLPNLPRFDVTDYFSKEWLVGDIPDILRMTNTCCPLADIHGISNGGNLFSISFGDIQIRFWLSGCEVVQVEISRVFASTREPLRRIFYIEGREDYVLASCKGDVIEWIKDFREVFKLDLVKRHSDYAVLRKEMLTEYEI